MTPLKVLSSDPGGSDRLAAQVVARPDQNPPPPIESWPYKLVCKALMLRLSSRCSSDCLMCERESWKSGDKDAEQDMPREVWERVKTAWLSNSEPGSLELHGLELAGLGEPTMSPLFPEIVQHTLSLQKVIFFPTNGHLLSLEKIWGCMGDGTNVRCSVSIDADSDESYVASGRGKAGQFAKVLDNVREFKRRLPNVALVSQFTGNITSIRSLPGFMRIACDLGFEEVIFRFSQNWEQAREDVSLRFAKSLTEDMLNQAWQIAEDHNAAHPDKPLRFEAERRPYADGAAAEALLQPESVKNSPTERLKRYLQLAPQSVVVNCNGRTTISDSGTCTTTMGSTSTTAGNPGIYTSQSYYTPQTEVWSDTVVCGSATCVRQTTSKYIQYTETTLQHFFTSSTLITQDPCPGFGSMSTSLDGTPEDGVIRSVIVARGSAMSAMSVPEQPISFVDSSPVVWSNGEITSCFAKHRIGNVFDDDLNSLTNGIWYQNWLQTRDGAGLGIAGNDACMNCPRTF